MKTLSIITIGNELLSGKTIDTNSIFLSKELSKLHYQTKQKICIGDNYNEIWETLKQVKEKYDLTIITGGLGPTSDDITKKVIADFFNASLTLNRNALKHLKEIFNKHKKPLTENNIQLAHLPNNCTPLHNPIGTAYGMWFKRKKHIYVSLPGVPMEMQKIYETGILPKINKGKQISNSTNNKELVSFFIGESKLSQKLISYEKNITPPISLAYLPATGYVRIRLTNDSNTLQSKKNFSKLWVNLKRQIKEHILYEGEMNLEEKLVLLLKKKKLSMSTAESCTGGGLAAQIVKLEKASDVFNGSLVCYKDHIKINQLNISKKLLETKGAVSKECIEQMATNICQHFDSDIGIATSGYIGKNQTNISKELRNTFFIAVKYFGHIKIKKLQVFLTREKNIEQIINQAMIFAIACLLEKKLT